MDILKEFESTKSRVEFLLKNYKSLRSNDTKLWISYLVMYHNLQASLTANDPCTTFCDLVLNETVPNMETIRRVRQKLQEDGAYPKGKKEPSSEKEIKPRSFVKERVIHLLKEHKPLRDDDKKLWLSYLIQYHDFKNKINNSDDPYETLCTTLIEEVPAIETVRRCRQMIQEEGKYVGEKRRERVSAAKKVAQWSQKRGA